METNNYENNSEYQSITITLASEELLKNTAKWGKLLAIIGFSIVGLIALIYVGTLAGTLLELVYGSRVGALGGVFTSFLFIAVAILYFIPMLYLYRFSNKMQEALRLKNESLITDAFKNLKSLFKFMGIVTVALILFYGVSVVFLAIGAS